MILKMSKTSARDSPVMTKETKTRPEGKNCVRKFAFATRVGYHPNNPSKANQDSYILQPNLQGLSQVHFFGVCDGHG